MHSNPFSDSELAARVAATRAAMAADGIDIALFSAPENIFYLIGLDHWGYFAPHVLIVPADGELALVTRQMERVVIGNQVRNARFIGHDDSETAADVVVRHLSGQCANKVVGIEAWSSGLSHGMGRQIVDSIAAARWQDVTGLIDRLRLVKSAEEQVFVRAAARAADAGTQAAIAAESTQPEP